ncbi:hypothetical protein GCM10010365_24320 [Streptomyces poonensis]|uniref:Uncharacterized protein n=1 Tax=Streptomyces poonensis TaxID=68255 RepID=A0A918PF80_9ACTN|nr:hypothetical protein GCM10010365_24320 [Streptomyces poonensis]GLJ89376.1 hypothetical protein GCM10017589_19760 [Streptomyces poonensis]
MAGRLTLSAWSGRSRPARRARRRSSRPAGAAHRTGCPPDCGCGSLAARALGQDGPAAGPLRPGTAGAGRKRTRTGCVHADRTAFTGRISRIVGRVEAERLVGGSADGLIAGLPYG